MTESRITPEIRKALALTARARGWAMRDATIRRFEVGTCLLYIVPFRCWANRRMERQSEDWKRAHGDT